MSMVISINHSFLLRQERSQLLKTELLQIGCKKKKDAKTKAEKKFMFEQNSDPQPSRT